MSRSLNIKDAWEHRRILQGITDGERQELRASGMSFKEIARTLDIPGGVAFRILYDRIERDRYPAPFIDDKALTRQPKEWYEATHNFELARGADAYVEAPRPEPKPQEQVNDDLYDDLFIFRLQLPPISLWLDPWDEE